MGYQKQTKTTFPNFFKHFQMTNSNDRLGDGTRRFVATDSSESSPKTRSSLQKTMIEELQ